MIDPKRRTLTECGLHIPQSCREWWRTATRDQRTHAINSGIDRKAGGALENHVDSQWKLQEQVNQERKKKNAIKSEAVIQEVAETMCGGPLKLRQAVARGAIVVRREGGVDLICLPFCRDQAPAPHQQKCDIICRDTTVGAAA